MTALLDALYSARNLALHSGAFTASGDAILGRGGTMLVDFTFEFLGNWYRTTTGAALADSPIQIIDELAARQADVLRRLTSYSEPVHLLDVSFLTGPSVTGAWGRT
jgi:hypothetical protein